MGEQGGDPLSIAGKAPKQETNLGSGESHTTSTGEPGGVPGDSERPDECVGDPSTSSSSDGDQYELDGNPESERDIAEW